MLLASDWDDAQALRSIEIKNRDQCLINLSLCLYQFTMPPKKNNRPVVRKTLAPAPFTNLTSNLSLQQQQNYLAAQHFTDPSNEITNNYKESSVNNYFFITIVWEIII
jgi:hypothetical protein